MCRKGEREKGGTGSDLGGGGMEVVTARREDDLLARLSGRYSLAPYISLLLPQTSDLGTCTYKILRNLTILKAENVNELLFLSLPEADKFNVPLLLIILKAEKFNDSLFFTL